MSKEASIIFPADGLWLEDRTVEEAKVVGEQKRARENTRGRG